MWNTEDKECAKLFSEQGLSAREISNEMSIPENTIKYWRKAWGHSSKNTSPDLYKGTIEEIRARLIDIMHAAPIVTYTYFNSKDSGTPAATTYRKYFGSWEAALEAAGIVNTSTLNRDKPTTVYLVEFDGFYKIGITQQTVHQRLGGRYPKYEIVMQVTTTLEEAKALERKWLDAVKHTQYVPEDFPIEGRGFTECFKL